MPGKGSWRRVGEPGKVSDAHARCGRGRPLPHPPPNTFYINSTHQAYSPYGIAPPISLSRLLEKLNFPFLLFLHGC